MGLYAQKLERFRATLYVRALKVFSTVELNETLARKKGGRP